MHPLAVALPPANFRFANLYAAQSGKMNGRTHETSLIVRTANILRDGCRPKDGRSRNADVLTKAGAISQLLTEGGRMRVQSLFISCDRGA